MEHKLDGWYLDLEADDLYLKSTKIWYIRLTSLDKSRTLAIKPFEIGKEKARRLLLEWINSFEDGAYVSFHSGLGYDAWMLWKFLDIKPRVGKKSKDWLGDKHVQFVDTYCLSMFLQPNLPFHNLEYLARGSEDEKMAFRAKLIELKIIPHDSPKGAEFKQWHPLMGYYCDDDVAAGLGVLERLWSLALEMYGDKWLHASFRQFQKDFFLYSAQAYSGVKFHQERAKTLLANIAVTMEEIRKEVEPELPPRKLKAAEQAYYKIPAKPFKKDGTLSKPFTDWLVKHEARYHEDTKTIVAYNKIVKLVPNAILPVELPMEIDDNVELKDYFIKSGWVPSDDYWNLKKGPDGKPERDARGKVIKTTPKIQIAGVIDPALLEIEGEIPKKVVKFLSLRNRQSVVTTWLANWRMEFDGRLSAEISGYAPTSRVKHKTVTNVPKADPKVLLGYEMRDLFTVEDGFWYVGTDAAALENRTLASYTYKHDNGEFARMQLEGDPHSFNAFAFFPELHDRFDIDNKENKEIHEFKPFRNKAKTGAYLLAFGGGANKLASSLGLSKEKGLEAFNNYWEKNVGLGKLKEAAEAYYTTTGQKKYLPGKDGRIVSVRGKNVLLSCLGQGLGAIAMSYAACFMDNWLGELYLDEMFRPYYLYKGHIVRRISMVHDEYSWEVQDGVQEEIRDLSVKAIVMAGEYLKLSLPLAGEGKMSFEGSWKDVH
jgi:hypothetical protein